MGKGLTTSVADTRAEVVSDAQVMGRPRDWSVEGAAFGYGDIEYAIKENIEGLKCGERGYSLVSLADGGFWDIGCASSGDTEELERLSGGLRLVTLTDHRI